MKFPLLLLLLIGFYSVAFAQKEKKHLALVRLDGKCGFIDAFGREVIPLVYDDAGPWGNNLVPVNIGKYVSDADPVVLVAPSNVNPKDSIKGNEQYKTVDKKKEDKGKWGYCDTSGALVIPVQFSNTTFFNEGVAGVEINGKWGFINTSGKIVVQPVYDKIGHFSQGLAVVAKNGLYGYINLKGEEVIKLQYVNAKAFENGFAQVWEKYTSIKYNKNSIGRIINLKGEIVTDAKYDIDDTFSNGLFSFWLPEGELLLGLMNTKGQTITPPIYNEISSFNNGLARVMVYKEDNNFKEFYPNYGYINTNGKEVVNVGLAKASEFYEGLAVVARFDNKDDGELDHALINTKGEFVLGYNWKQLVLLDRKHLLAISIKNPSETLLITPQGKKILSFEKEDKGIADLGNGLFALINTEGEPLGLVGLNKQIPFNASQNTGRKYMSYQFGLIRFRHLSDSNEKTPHFKIGLVNLKGSVLVKPKYNEISSFESTDNTL